MKDENVIENLKKYNQTRTLKILENVDETIKNKIIEQLKQDRKMLLASNLLNTVATMLNDMTVGIVFQNGLTPFVKSIMEKPENIQELTRLVSIECGKEMRIKLLDCQDAILAQKAKQKNSEDTIKEELDIPINIIEE